MEPRNPNHEILVGWDPPLNTYFVHVIDTTKEEDDKKRDILWIGTSPGEIHDVVKIANAVRPYTKRIPFKTMDKIYRDANG